VFYLAYERGDHPALAQARNRGGIPAELMPRLRLPLVLRLTLPGPARMKFLQ